ncbi:MAG TPA: hypothetical protein VGD43_06795, partial [Micromonospora sp.]
MTTLADPTRAPDVPAEPPHRVRRRSGRWAARGVVAFAVAWLLFVLLHLALTGRFWFWVLPDLVPPPVFTLVPLLLLAVAG